MHFKCFFKECENHCCCCCCNCWVIVIFVIVLFVVIVFIIEPMSGQDYFEQPGYSKVLASLFNTKMLLLLLFLSLLLILWKNCNSYNGVNECARLLSTTLAPPCLPLTSKTKCFLLLSSLLSFLLLPLLSLLLLLFLNCF